MAVTVRFAIFTSLFLLLLLLATATPPRPTPSTAGCAAELVAFSPCLPYVSAWPNNITDTVTAQCCEALSEAFDSGGGGGDCFCYLIKQPMIFGFPLNRSRFLSLPSACSLMNSSYVAVVANQASLEAVCSEEAPALPPLHSGTSSVMPLPVNSGSDNAGDVSPVASLPMAPGTAPTLPFASPEPVVRSPTTFQMTPPPPPPPGLASAAESFSKNYRILPGLALLYLSSLNCKAKSSSYAF